MRENCTLVPTHELKKLHEQLAEKEFEIERLKAAIPDKTKRDRECITLEDWRMAALYYESQWSNCSYGYNKAVGDLNRQLAEKDAEIDEEQRHACKMAYERDCMSVQLAASQAVNQQLLEKVHLALTVNYSREFADNRAAILQEALALPQDTTALEAMIVKAGEVMRERCIEVIDCEAIRALPGVTMEDLK